jgi:transposase
MVDLENASPEAAEGPEPGPPLDPPATGEPPLEEQPVAEEAPPDPSESDEAVEYRVRGTKPKLTRVIHDFIVEQVKAGSYKNTAVAAAGLAQSTFYRWMARARREVDRLEGRPQARLNPEEKPYVDLFFDLRRGEADSKLDCITIIRNAAVANWNAAAWLLERKYPGEFGANRILKLQVEEEHEAFLAKLERRLPAEVFDVVLLAATEPDDEVLPQGPHPGARRKAGGRKERGAGSDRRAGKARRGD